MKKIIIFCCPFITEIKNQLILLKVTKLYFVYDPSDDGTYEEIKRELQKDSKLGMIVFSRRFFFSQLQLWLVFLIVLVMHV